MRLILPERSMARSRFGQSISGLAWRRIQKLGKRCGACAGYRKLGGAKGSRLLEQTEASRSIVKPPEDEQVYWLQTSLLRNAVACTFLQV